VGSLQFLVCSLICNPKVKSFRCSCECCRAHDQPGLETPNFSRPSPWTNSTMRLNVINLIACKDEKFVENVRRFNMSQANNHIIGQRVGTTRRNIGLCHKKTAAEFAQALPSQLANFGLSSLDSHSQSRITLTKCPMLKTPCPPFALGT